LQLGARQKAHELKRLSFPDPYPNSVSSFCSAFSLSTFPFYTVAKLGKWPLQPRQPLFNPPPPHLPTSARLPFPLPTSLQTRVIQKQHTVARSGTRRVDCPRTQQLLLVPRGETNTFAIQPFARPLQGNSNHYQLQSLPTSRTIHCVTFLMRDR
jgi:hypothetical protein